MRASDRLLLAVVLVAVDLFIFVLPLTGLLAAYLIVARPPWFRRWVDELYAAPR